MTKIKLSIKHKVIPHPLFPQGGYPPHTVRWSSLPWGSQRVERGHNRVLLPVLYKRILLNYLRNQKKLFAIFCIFIISIPLMSQEEELKNWELNGYLSNMQSMLNVPILGDDWISNNYFHNRLNFFWYPNTSLTASIQLRSRFFYGEYVRSDTTGTFAKGLEMENGAVDLSHNLLEESSFLFNSMIDRIWIEYTTGNFVMKIGRQRINWGQTFAWNPNDIFNTYSFFDFDYIERPGSDAIRLQYYTGMASSIEGAVKLDSAQNITAAGLVKLNKWNYDIQLMAGVLSSSDYVIGGGWSGNIKNTAFRGEMSYFHPIENPQDTAGIFYSCIGADYSFKNSLYLQFEALYGYMPKALKANIIEFFSGTQNVKKLSFSEYSLLGQVSYPISPLIGGGFSAMVFYDTEDYDGKNVYGFYLGPNISYNINDNFDASLTYQYFRGNFPDLYTGDIKIQNYHFAFFRIKWSF